MRRTSTGSNMQTGSKRNVPEVTHTQTRTPASTSTESGTVANVSVRGPGVTGMSWADPPIDRILIRTEIRPDGCHEFIGGSRNGSRGQYRRIMVNKVLIPVHRYVYEFYFGPIPDGYTIDHTCGLTTCVNPLHLDAVPRGVNARRHWQAQREMCRNRLHPLDEYGESVIGPRGTPSLRCRACHEAAMKRTVEKARARRADRGVSSPQEPPPTPAA